MSKLRRNLYIVFDETTAAPGHAPVEGRRYVALATGKSPGNWRVFDKVRDRFLTDREVREIEPREMLEAGRA